MIDKYHLFRFYSILNESRIDFQSNFEKVLSLIRSPISKSLLDLIHTEVDLDIDNVGTTEVDDVVSFTTPKKFPSKIIYQVINNGYFTDDKLMKKFGIPSIGIGYYPHPTIGERVIIEEVLDENDLKSLYGRAGLPKKILHVKSLDKNWEYAVLPDYIEKTNSIFPESRKHEIKIGRLINKILLSVGKKFPSKDIEEFVNEFKSKIELIKNNFRNFELIEGDLIRNYYDGSSYDPSYVGTLHSSCMRYPKCQEYFDIYIKNPEVCKLLILKSDVDPSKITARSLIWKCSNGITVMDRIYYSKASESNLFIEYSNKMGWYHKETQSSVCGLVTLEDKSINIQKDPLIVKLKECDFDHYPFIDTFFFLNRKNSTLSTSGSSDVQLQDTEGRWIEECEECEGEGTIECAYCDGRGVRNCSDCNGAGTMDCKSCEGEGVVDCDDCDGGIDKNGNKCSNCEGKGKLTCDDCYGRRVDCDNCEGSGTVDCDDCDNGRIDCPECN